MDEVNLQDLLAALGGPLEEKALWALLYKTCCLLKQELNSEFYCSHQDSIIKCLSPYSYCSCMINN